MNILILESLATGAVLRITSDINLTHDVVMPDNCTLIFEGGTIRGNYTLYGSNTSIIAPPCRIFNSVNLSGTWNVDKCYVEWWGAIGNQETDDTAAIQSAFDSPFEKVIFLSKVYRISNHLTISRKKSIVGLRQWNDTSDTPPSTPKLYSVTPAGYMIGIMSSFVTIKNLSIRFYNEASRMEYGFYMPAAQSNIHLEGCGAFECSYGFYLKSSNAVIERCTSIGSIEGFRFNESSNISMINCHVKGYKRNAFNLVNVSAGTMIDCSADTWTHSSQVTETEGNWYTYKFFLCKNISMINCGAEEAVKAAYLDSCINVEVQGCWFDISNLNCSTVSRCILSFINTRRISIDGLYVSNWKCTGWTSPTGWFNETNLFRIYSENNIRNSVKLHNVYYRGYARDASIYGPVEVIQIISSQLISSVAASGCVNDVLVEYDWSHRGSTAMRPSGVDAIVGVGFVYYNTTSNQMEVWNGTSWQTV